MNTLGDKLTGITTVAFFGPPGAGKTTLTNQLRDEFKLQSFGMRIFVTKLVKMEHPIAREVRVATNGFREEIPIALVEKLLRLFINEYLETERLLILEGVPLNSEQFELIVKTLPEYGGSLDLFFNFHSSYEFLQSRVLNRKICRNCESKKGHELSLQGNEYSSCPKCGSELSIRRSDSRAEFDKRYSNYLNTLNDISVSAHYKNRVDIEINARNSLLELVRKEIINV